MPRVQCAARALLSAYLQSENDGDDCRANDTNDEPQQSHDRTLLLVCCATAILGRTVSDELALCQLGFWGRPCRA